MIEKIGDATLYLGDCLEIIPVLSNINAVITDPPYGININKSNRLSISKGHGNETWDDKPFEITQEFLSIADKYIIWGGNYFALPATRGFLIWDKNNASRDFADCEMAWTNQNKNARIFVMRPMNMDGGKEHPTQKPVALMEWCISYLDNPDVILDPFMGSGSTGIACGNMGKKFIGIEKEKKYFDIACKRIENSQRQKKLFI
jgi:site-specific DNA-methyltransferase (adenine-specific)/modification methylase